MAKYPNIWLIWLFGYLAIWLGATNMPEWGIPEKSIKNVAQRRWPKVRRTLQSKVIAQKSFTIFFPCILPCIAKKISMTISGQVSDLAQMSNSPKLPKYHESKRFQSWETTCSKTTHAINQYISLFSAIIFSNIWLVLQICGSFW